MRSILVLIVSGLFLYSCDSSRVSEEIKDIDTYWLADSIAHFTFTIREPNQDYNVLFYVRNGVNFPHANLYFKYALQDSLGATLESELVNLQLFHAKSGYPLGSGVGDLFEHNYELLTKYRFAHTGAYQLSFQQYMRYDSLPEIFSVGYRLEKTIDQ